MSKRRDIEPTPGSGELLGTAGRKVIATIGIDRYHHWPQLTNAVHDANGAAKAFRRLGFEEIEEPLLDERATARAIEELVTERLMKQLGPDDSLVLFYAGHGGTRRHRLGDQEIKTGYLIPADALSSPDKVVTWLDLDGWLREISLLPARHILVILDACHSGVALDPIIKWRDVRSRQDAPLSTLAMRRSRRIITSALDDQVALDSGPVSGHSLFTGCLIEGLSGGTPRDGSGVITGSELGLYVQRRVKTFPYSRQTPDFGAFAFDDRGEMMIPLASEGVAAGDGSSPRPAPPPAPIPGPPAEERPEPDDELERVPRSRRGLKLLAAAAALAAVAVIAIRSLDRDSVVASVTPTQLAAGSASSPARPCSGMEGCRAACRGGDQTACVDLGKLLAHANGAREAHALFDAACNAGDGRGCIEAGLALLRGTGVPTDAAAARVRIERSCDLEIAKGCEVLATLFEQGNGVPRNEHRAFALYARSCQLGGWTACMAQASMYDQGVGVAQDTARAIAIYQELCDARHGDACSVLGRIYLEGKKVPRDKERGIELLQASCDHGSSVSCAILGNAYEKGIGVGVDKALARRLLARACEAGYRSACEQPQPQPQPAPRPGGQPKPKPTPSKAEPPKPTPGSAEPPKPTPGSVEPPRSTPKDGEYCSEVGGSWGAWCGGRCVNTYNHNQHCGKCFNSCPGESYCDGGRCKQPQRPAFP